MSVRIGYGLGTAAARTPDASRFGALVGALERHGFDSLWLSERIGGDVVDPVVGLAFAAALTTRLKLGFSVMVLPGRNPALVAKELASLDCLSGGRLLPAFGLGAPNPREHQAFGLEPAQRAAWLEEALPLLRRFWSEGRVDHDGARFQFHDVEVRPKPLGRMEVWLGGAGDRQLDRVGRLANGWLGSFNTPDEAGTGRRAIEDSARRSGREIDPGHFGTIVLYTPQRLDDAAVDTLMLRRRGRPRVDVEDVVAQGDDALVPLLQRYVDSGITKFVLMPLHDPSDWDEELGALAQAVAPMQGAPVGAPAA
ncbi:MAG TPA: LLM class flavin-dependent oxidoreductase [Candidatus Dormibacteraeota bacterium]|jgi:probable F420-dependent oxidoreductase|nr:LLM class flavin-dependent oxidoreductase [Candidatus Dormibacteraeota bacterium]